MATRLQQSQQTCSSSQQRCAALEQQLEATQARATALEAAMLEAQRRAADASGLQAELEAARQLAEQLRGDRHDGGCDQQQRQLLEGGQGQTATTVDRAADAKQQQWELRRQLAAEREMREQATREVERAELQLLRQRELFLWMVPQEAYRECEAQVEEAERQLQVLEVQVQRVSRERDALREEVQATLRQQQELELQLCAASRQAEQLQQQGEQAAEQAQRLQELEAQVKEAHVQLQAAVEQKDAAVGEAGNLEQRLQGLERQRDAVVGEVAGLQQQVERAEQARDAAEALIHGLQQRLDSSELQAATLAERLQAAQAAAQLPLCTHSGSNTEATPVHDAGCQVQAEAASSACQAQVEVQHKGCIAQVQAEHRSCQTGDETGWDTQAVLAEHERLAGLVEGLVREVQLLLDQRTCLQAEEGRLEERVQGLRVDERALAQRVEGLGSEARAAAERVAALVAEQAHAVERLGALQERAQELQAAVKVEQAAAASSQVQASAAAQAAAEMESRLTKLRQLAADAQAFRQQEVDAAAGALQQAMEQAAALERAVRGAQAGMEREVRELHDTRVSALADATGARQLLQQALQPLRPLKDLHCAASRLAAAARQALSGSAAGQASSSSSAYGHGRVVQPCLPAFGQSQGSPLLQLAKLALEVCAVVRPVAALDEQQQQQQGPYVMPAGAVADARRLQQRCAVAEGAVEELARMVRKLLAYCRTKASAADRHADPSLALTAASAAPWQGSYGDAAHAGQAGGRSAGSGQDLEACVAAHRSLHAAVDKQLMRMLRLCQKAAAAAEAAGDTAAAAAASIATPGSWHCGQQDMVLNSILATAPLAQHQAQRTRAPPFCQSLSHSQQPSAEVGMFDHLVRGAADTGSQPAFMHSQAAAAEALGTAAAAPAASSQQLLRPVETGQAGRSSAWPASASPWRQGQGRPAPGPLHSSGSASTASGSSASRDSAGRAVGRELFPTRKAPPPRLRGDAEPGSGYILTVHAAAAAGAAPAVADGQDHAPTRQPLAALDNRPHPTHQGLTQSSAASHKLARGDPSNTATTYATATALARAQLLSSAAVLTSSHAASPAKAVLTPGTAGSSDGLQRQLLDVVRSMRGRLASQGQTAVGQQPLPPAHLAPSVGSAVQGQGTSHAHGAQALPFPWQKAPGAAVGRGDDGLHRGGGQGPDLSSGRFNSLHSHYEGCQREGGRYADVLGDDESLRDLLAIASP